MPEILLPFKIPDPKNRKKSDSCNILSLLSKPTQALVEKNPHLLEYLEMIPLDDYGMPKFYDKLDKSIGGTSNPNLIYPVKEGVFTHILYDHGDGRNSYIPIEPILITNIDPLMLEVEKKLLEMSDKLGDFTIKTMDEKKDAFLKCVDEICVVKGYGGNGNGNRNNGNGQKKNGNGKTGIGLLDRMYVQPKDEAD